MSELKAYYNAIDCDFHVDTIICCDGYTSSLYKTYLISYLELIDFIIHKVSLKEAVIIFEKYTG